jgi:hypothetical protein
MNNWSHLNPLPKIFFLVFFLMLGYANDSFAQRKKHDAIPIDQNKPIIAEDGSTFTPVLQPKVKLRKNIFERLREKLHETFSKKEESLEGENEEEEEGMRTDRPDLAAEQEFRITKDPRMGYVPTERLKAVRERIKELRALKIQNPTLQNPILQGATQQNGSLQTLSSGGAANWSERGPSNVGGRTRAIMFDPNDATKKKVWAGGAGGGLWYTNDITATTPVWNNVSDVWANMAISSIAYNPANTQEFYVGTGEGWYNGDAIRGAGIWKSSDGGSSWTQLSSIATDINFDYVQKIVVTSGGVIFAATRSRFCNRGGVYKSTNGGTSWTLSFGTQGSSCGASNSSAADLEIGSDGTIYATMGIFNLGGIYKSSDVGATWTQLNTGSNGFPTTGFYRIEMCVAPSDPNRLYAMAHSSSTNALLNIYTSANKGSTWTTCTLPSWVDQSCGSPSSDMTRTQAWYDLIIAVDPNNPATLIVGGVDLMKSTDSGTTWTQISSWAGACSRQYVHADQHAIVYQPGSSTVALFGNDGGVYYTANANATIPTIAGKNTGYNVTQFYACAIHPTAGQDYYLAGAQDNGTHKFTSPGINTTSQATGGDGAYCFIDQTNPTYQISSYVYNNFYLTTNNWSTSTSISSTSTGDFINPADYDDTNHILYSSYSATQIQRISGITGTRTTAQFTVTGMAAKAGHLRVSPYAPSGTSTLFVGTQDSKLFKVTNAQGTPTITNISGASFPAGATISCVEIGATENDLLVTFSNYGVVSVWRTTNGGTTWASVEGNLPDMPVRWALYNPINRSQVLLATEMGVWTTTDITVATPSWLADNTIANVRVDMLQIRNSDKQVVAATHGRGLFTASIACESPLITSPPAAPTATCSGTGTQILSVGATGTSLTYSWRRNGVALTNGGVISGSTTATLTLTNPTTANAGSYDVVVTNLGCATVTPTAVTVTVNATPSITAATIAAPVYTSGSDQVTTLSYSAASNFPTNYSITWNNSPSNSFAAVTNVALPASPINITVPGGTAPENYYGSISVTNASGCVSSSSLFSVQVYAVPTISTGTVSTSICAGAAVNVPYFITSTFGGSNIFTAQLSNASGSFANPTAIGTYTATTAGTINAVIPANTPAGTGYQIRVVSSAPTVIGTTANSGAISVNSAPTAFAGNPVSICQSANPVAIILSSAAIGGLATTGTWSITSGGGTLSNTSATTNPASVSYTPAANFNGTVTLLLTTNAGTGCGAATSSLTITVNATPTATAGNNLTACQSSSPTPITLSGASVGGSATNGAWSITTGSGVLSSIAQTANPSSVTYTPAANANETVTLTLTSNAGTGCAAATATRTITINQSPTITAASFAASVYASSSSQTSTLSYSAVTGSPTTYSMTWNASPANSFIAVNNAALTASPISVNIPANTAPGVYNGTITVSNSFPCSSAGSTFTLTVIAVPTITPGTITTPICVGTTINVPFTITSNFISGNVFTAQLSDAAGSFTNPTNIGTLTATASGTIVATIPSNQASGTGYRIRVISTLPVVTGTQNSAALTINALPTANAGGPDLVCQSATPIGLTLSGASVGGSAISGAWSITSGGGTLSNTTQTTNPALVTYTPLANATGTVLLQLTTNTGSGCTVATATRTITLDPLPTITTAASTNAVCQSNSSQSAALTYSATTGSPVSYSITWSPTPANSFAVVSNAVLTANAIDIVVPANTLAGTYTGTITVKNANGCISIAKTFTLTVNPTPSITPAASATALYFNANSQITALTYSATTGIPTNYSIVWNPTPSNSFVVVNNASLPLSPIGISVPGGADPGTYTGTISVSNAGGCISSLTNFDVTIIPTPTIVTGTVNNLICTGAAIDVPFTITSTFATGNIFTAQLSDANGSFANPSAIGTLNSLGAGTIQAVIPSGINAGSAYQIRVVSSAPGIIGTPNSGTISINSQPTVFAGNPISVCRSASPSAITLSGATIGGIATTGTWSIVSGGGTLSSTLPTNDPASVTYTPTANFNGTVTLLLTTDVSTGCSAATSTLVITVNNLASATAGSDISVCQSATPTAITLSGASVGGSATTGAWSITTGGGTLSSTAQTTSPGSVTYTPAVNASETVTLTLTSNAGAGCTSTTAIRTININPTPSITLGATAASVYLSASSQTTTLNYTATSGSPTTYSITWNATPSNNFAAVTNAVLPATPINITVPANTPVGTYTGVLTVKNANGCISTSSTFTITVNAVPSIATGTIGTPICAGSSINVPFTITGTFINGNSFIAQLSDATGAFTSPTSIGTLTATTAGTITASIPSNQGSGAAYRIRVISTTPGVNGTQNGAAITINALPTANAGGPNIVCQAATPTALVLNGASVGGSATTGAWSITSGGGTLSSIAQTATPATVTYTPAANATGIISLRLTSNAGTGCTAAIVTRTITLDPLPTITTATSATAVCQNSSSQSTLLSYSATTGSPLTYSITWNATPTNGFAAVSNATLSANSISLAIPANAAAGTYTGNITVKNANGCTSISKTFTITVNALPTITNATSATAVCFSANAQTTPLTYSATTGTPTTYSIVWNATPSNAFVAVNNATLTASSIGIAVPAGTAAGVYTGTLTVKNANGCVSANKTFTVTINALPTITAAATATSVCQSTTAQISPLSYSATSGTPTTYSIAWTSTPTNTFVAVNNAPLPVGSISIAVPANTPAGTYTGTLTVRNANGCISVGTPFTITVNPLPSISSVATASAVCLSSASQLTTLSYSATTGSPLTYSLTWNTTPTNSFAAVSNATLPANAINITVPANAAATTYTGNLTVRNANGCASISKTFTITVNAIPTITNATSATAVCFNVNAQTTPLTYSATSGTPTTYSIVWNATPSNSFAAVTNATLTANSIGIVVPAGTAGGVYTGILTVKNANGCVSANKTFTVTINALPTITAAATATSVCQSTTAQTSPLSYSATSGTPNTYSIAWNSTPTNAFVAVNNATLPVGSINIAVPANTPAGTYTGTLTARNASGCISVGTPFTITVNPLPSISSTATASAVCLLSASQLTTLSYSATTGSPLTYSLTWNTTPTNSFAAVSNATLPANAINITVPANAAANTYTGNLTVRNVNGCASTTKSFTVAVNALPTITTAATAAAVCSSVSAQTTNLTYSATTNAPTKYSITWNATPVNTFKAIVDTALTTSPIVLIVPANTAPGTYTGTIRVKNANGCESAARNFTITVNALISITVAAAATNVTASTVSQTTPLTYSATTGAPNTYSITWNPTPINSFAAVTNTALPTSPIRVTVPANTPAGTFTGNLTVRNTGGCVSAPNVFTVTVTGIAAIAANNIAEIGNATGLSLNNGIPPVDPDKAELLQNVPNPFHDLTQIGFYLPKSTDGYLTIRDEKGSVVYRQKAAYYQGWNQVTIKNNDLKAVGLLYYTLDTPDFSATKKMILLQK